jgi:outer membrane protein assembly factor BamB
MRLVLISVLVSIASSYAFAAEWPDWRGPTADGRSDATGLPLEWSETENVVWKTAIHDLGHSTPVVWGDQIWMTTATEDGSVQYAVCADLNSGEIVYDIELFKNEKPQRLHPNNSYATPSAAIEEGRVYVHFGTFGTAAIDSATGEVLWRRTDLNCDHMQGPVSSPILYEDLIILDLEGVDKQFMAALDKQTGETVWLYHRPEDLYDGTQAGYLLKSYHTPVLVEVEGEIQLESNGGLLATGHDPRTGEELWRILYRDDNPISRIVTGNGLLFINSGGNPGGSELFAVREGGEGDITESHVVWKMTKDVCHESSPVLVDGLLYTMSDRGTLICMEAATGEQVWVQELDGKYGASLLAADGRIYLSNKKGMTTVIAPGRAFNALAVNQLDGELWTSPAVAANSLLLRTKTHLYRIQYKK